MTNQAVPKFDPEVENLLSNFREEFLKKMCAARISQETEGFTDVELGRVCLAAAANEFRPLSLELKKLAKRLDTLCII